MKSKQHVYNGSIIISVSFHCINSVTPTSAPQISNNLIGTHALNFNFLFFFSLHDYYSTSLIIFKCREKQRHSLKVIFVVCDADSEYPNCTEKIKTSVPSCRSIAPAESQYAPQLMAYKEAAVIRAIAHKYHLTTATIQI